VDDVTTRILTSILEVAGSLLLILAAALWAGLGVNAIVGGAWGWPMAVMVGGGGLVGLSWILVGHFSEESE